MKKNLFFSLLFFAVTLINAQRPIITRWNVPLTPNSIKIKIGTYGSFSYQYLNVNNSAIIGQGNGVGVTTINLPEAGEYMVYIYPTGTFKFDFNSTAFNSTDRQKFIEISQWGDVNWYTDLSEMFQNLFKLKITATDIPDFSNVTNMSLIFSECGDLTTVPKMNNWSVSNVTDMSGMFLGANDFNENIANWNTSKVTDMNWMFMGASKFNQNIGNWDTSKVTNMTQMFWEATNFNQNIGNWDTSKVIYMSGMFSSATNFNQFIGNWDTSKTTNMNGMFKSATKFNQNIGNWNISGVDDMRDMFNGAINFNQNLGNWKLRSNGISANNMSNMIDNSGMDCENYSKTLYGWAQNINSPTFRKFGAVGRRYGTSGQIYRNKLVQLKGWTITGDSFDSNCTFQLATSENKNNNAAIYPNPTSGIVNIYSKITEEVSIYNSMGQLMRKEILQTGNNKVDISAFPNGVYLLQKENKTYKLIKK